MPGTKTVLIGVALAAMLAGCYRGQPSNKTPVHLVGDMDHQNKYRPQSASPLFADGAAARQPVAGTVAQGDAQADAAWYRGLDDAGQLVAENPAAVTLPLLERGRERYNIYCSPCHSQIGDGQGIMLKRGYVPPPTFHDARLRGVADGHIFDVISHGVRNMPAYAHQVPVADRWAIVAYIRALQRAQNGRGEDIPEQIRTSLK